MGFAKGILIRGVVPKSKIRSNKTEMVQSTAAEAELDEAAGRAVMAEQYLSGLPRCFLLSLRLVNCMFAFTFEAIQAMLLDRWVWKCTKATVVSA